MANLPCNVGTEFWVFWTFATSRIVMLVAVCDYAGFMNTAAPVQACGLHDVAVAA